MAATLRIPLGAPGIYKLPDEPVRALTGVRMDVCAFVGVAPRGPAREPLVDEKWPADRPFVEPDRPRRRSVAVPVESFDEYRRRYGGFEGPGLLPYSVASFFEQGGKRAYIVRIVHDYGNALDNAGRVAIGSASGAITPSGPVKFIARNEGAWGNGLTAQFSFTRTPVRFEAPSAAGVSLPENVTVPLGSRVECLLEDGTRHLRTIAAVFREGRAGRPGVVRVATFDTPLADKPRTLEVLDGELAVDDGEGRRETFHGLGLDALHPRWAATVVSAESNLVLPDASWSASEITPDPGAHGEPFAGGEDGYEDIVPGDFFDPSWTPAQDEPGSGVHCLTQLSDVSILVVPDLYSPFPLAPSGPVFDPPAPASPDFVRCVPETPVPAEPPQLIADLAGLRLDPLIPAELAEIVTLQLRLEEFASLMRCFIVLLDVPPGLNQRQILRWRAPFSSAYAAAYHPWLQVARRDDSRDVLVRMPPSAAAAGLIAKSEALFGIPRGPANLLAAEVVNFEDAVSAARHDELHPQGTNVYLRERDGIRLTAARTLSRESEWRQLSVRRLVTMIKRALEQQMQWAVFEPNNASLRADVRRLLTGFLRQLQRAGAFKGATDDESFFVKCDESLNTAREIDAGMLIAEIGVAPAEPIEFIVLRLSRDGDGTFTVEE